MTALEAIVVVLLDALTLGAMLSVSLATASSWRQLEDIASRISARRQIEQLADAAAADFLSVPPDCPARMLAAPNALRIVADLDRDGRIDVRSSESSAFELASSHAETVRLVHRIGRQRMTLLDGLAASTRLATRQDAAGAPVLVALPLDRGALAVGFERTTTKIDD